MAGCNGCEARLSGLSNVELLPALAGASSVHILEQRELSARVADHHTVFASLLSAEQLDAGFRWVFRSGPGIERRVRELARREHAELPVLSFVVSTHGDTVIWEAHAGEGAEHVLAAFHALPEVFKGAERTSAVH